MKVIGAGFGRTGTLSLKIALEKLGVDPCYHMIEVIKNPTHSTFWEKAADNSELGKPVDWEEVLSDYEATVDWPGCSFYPELATAYPDAKVLLSIRDPKRWYESARSTIGRGWEDSSKEESVPLKLIRRLLPSTRPNFSMIRKVILWRSFGKKSMNEPLSREEAIEAFERHNEEVKRCIPDERLLVYDVKQGWQPLCEFLDVPVPEEPFPHVNEREAFPRVMWRGVWARVCSQTHAQMTIAAMVSIAR